jgi:hypothetical protein
VLARAVLLRAPDLKLDLGSIHVAHFDEVPWFDGLQGMCARRKMGAQGLEAIRSRNKKQNGDFAFG